MSCCGAASTRCRPHYTEGKTKYLQLGMFDCSVPPLSPKLVHSHAVGNTLFATFTTRATMAFAVNWAVSLLNAGLHGIIGISGKLREQDQAALQRARAGLFCASGSKVRNNGQAGRWDEVIPLLQFGLTLVLTDVDIAWFRRSRPNLKAHVFAPLDPSLQPQPQPQLARLTVFARMRQSAQLHCFRGGGTPPR